MHTFPSHTPLPPQIYVLPSIEMHPRLYISNIFAPSHISTPHNTQTNTIYLLLRMSDQHPAHKQAHYIYYVAYRHPAQSAHTSPLSLLSFSTPSPCRFRLTGLLFRPPISAPSSPLLLGAPVMFPLAHASQPVPPETPTRPVSLSYPLFSFAVLAVRYLAVARLVPAFAFRPTAGSRSADASPSTTTSRPRPTSLSRSP